MHVGSNGRVFPRIAADALKRSAVLISNTGFIRHSPFFQMGSFIEQFLFLQH